MRGVEWDQGLRGWTTRHREMYRSSGGDHKMMRPDLEDPQSRGGKSQKEAKN
jgi:hypothetical protein